MAFSVIGYFDCYCLLRCVECPSVCRFICLLHCVGELTCLCEFDLSEVDCLAACCGHLQFCCSACRCRWTFTSCNAEAECSLFEACTFNFLRCECCLGSICVYFYFFRFIAVFNCHACNFCFKFSFATIGYFDCYCLLRGVECPSVCRFICLLNCVGECTCLCEFDLSEVDCLAACRGHLQFCCSACRCRCIANCCDAEVECSLFETCTFDFLRCKCCLSCICVYFYFFCFIDVLDLYTCDFCFKFSFAAIGYFDCYCLLRSVECPTCCCLVCLLHCVGICTFFCECNSSEIDCLAACFRYLNRASCLWRCRCPFTRCNGKVERSSLKACSFNCLRYKWCSCSICIYNCFFKPYCIKCNCSSIFCCQVYYFSLIRIVCCCSTRSESPSFKYISCTGKCICSKVVCLVVFQTGHVRHSAGSTIFIERYIISDRFPHGIENVLISCGVPCVCVNLISSPNLSVICRD